MGGGVYFYSATKNYTLLYSILEGGRVFYIATKNYTLCIPYSYVATG